MKIKTFSTIAVHGILTISLLATGGSVLADISEAQELQTQNGVLQSYRRLLPLEGGSNFRDMGGYETSNSKKVKRGLLYRSAVMTSLSAEDQEWLSQLGIGTVVDLRSNEERVLYPNHWVEDADIHYVTRDYSIMDLLGEQMTSLRDLENMDEEAMAAISSPGAIYNKLAYGIVPQLREYFDVLLAGEAPVVVNCSAGQDRTGITAGLLLTVLGVPREVVMEDYLLSSDFRRPSIERGSVDLETAAEHNQFAALMSRYEDAREESMLASPLMTAEGTPFLVIAFDQIEQDYGSIEAFMHQEVGVSEEDIKRLKALYLK